MNIGLTYDLKDDYLSQGFTREDVAELDSAATVDGIALALERLGHRVDRVGKISALVHRLARGDRWELVFNIAEGVRGSAREAQIPGLLEAYDIPVTFGSALCLAVCLDKGLTKRVLDSYRIPTPRFAVVDGPGAGLENLGLRYPLFAKPVGEGSGLGVEASGKVHNAEELRSVVARLVGRHRQPVLVEEFLPGREVTVGIVGTGDDARVLGVMEVVLLGGAEPEVYSYGNKDRYEERVSYRLAPDDGRTREAAAVALAAYRVLGCRDAGRADIREGPDGRMQFIEVNPLAGLNPRDSDLPILCRLLGIEYDRLVADIVDSAAKRTTGKIADK